MTNFSLSSAKQVLDNNQQKGRCPIWLHPVVPFYQVAPDNELRRYFDSPRAGGIYSISWNDTLEEGLKLADDVRTKLSHWIYQENRKDEIPHVTTKIIDQISQLPPLTADQRLDRFLRCIREELPGYSSDDPIELSWDRDVQYKITAATESDDNSYGLSWLAGEAERSGLITQPKKNAYVLTLDGMKRLDGSAVSVQSRYAFVAMWFDSSMNNVYEKGIRPAIEEAGYEPVRIDNVEHTDRIEDAIIAEIRRSRFVVCDFTCGMAERKQGKAAIPRGSVYYEAGYAHGLGIPVIWTCHQDLLEYVHFDVSHYNFITWLKPGDVRNRLRNRISATIGDRGG